MYKKKSNKNAMNLYVLSTSTCSHHKDQHSFETKCVTLRYITFLFWHANNHVAIATKKWKLSLCNSRPVKTKQKCFFKNLTTLQNKTYNQQVITVYLNLIGSSMHNQDMETWCVKISWGNNETKTTCKCNNNQY